MTEVLLSAAPEYVETHDDAEWVAGRDERIREAA